MRRKDESKKPVIVNYINDFFFEHDKVPTVREIVSGTSTLGLFRSARSFLKDETYADRENPGP